MASHRHTIDCPLNKRFRLPTIFSKTQPQRQPENQSTQQKPFSPIPTDLAFSGCLYPPATKKHRYACTHNGVS
ncbi:hypothetical protein GCWU000324_02359 [Kingella oralis ATCC 51147]|uniref:Uncharacterized protein n=1 Tax=Kingella oralis ATCC 51147 TaxID=629741 RepID=C4GJY5_9NEIS|nr:hypothetical protein GCWU000324_02359 [Kingella oralis ATCC 51147]